RPRVRWDTTDLSAKIFHPLLVQSRVPECPAAFQTLRVIGAMASSGVRRVDWTSHRVGRETLPRLSSHSVELFLGKRSHSLRLRDGTDPSPTTSPLTWTPCLRLRIARRS